MIRKIEDRESGIISRLLAVWKDSVKATHDFLSAKEIDAIEADVRSALMVIEALYGYYTEEGVVGFIGVEDRKIEMLFIDAGMRGGGVGRQLLDFAVCGLGARFVDVNEQNVQGRGFYEHMGFKVRSRSEFDEQGRPYPILHLEKVGKDEAMV